MSLLATLRAKKLRGEVATLTVATVATDEAETLPTVARVATVAVARPRYQGGETDIDAGRLPSVATVASVTVASPEVQRLEAVNDAAPAADPDRWCWPHSPAMNSREIGTFTDRLARFTGKGLTLEDGERLADKLVTRDREGDDRRLCLECAHLQGYNRWRCGNWRVADVAPQGLARDLVLMLQRCSGFRPANAGP